MTDSKAFKSILLIQHCYNSREVCNQDCHNCKYYLDLNTTNSVFNYLKDILKSRDPALYFASELQVLQELLATEINNKER